MAERISQEIETFIGSRRSLQLATINEDGTPFASYAPFAYQANALFVVLSDIAVHGMNLTRQPVASVLIVEDEDTAEELFARRRINYRVRAAELAYESEDWRLAVACLESRHGERPRRLAELGDFRVFRLSPEGGRYVKGFGKAYSLAGSELARTEINHLRDGHRARDGKAA